MSPLWRDRLIVGLTPARLKAVRLGKGLHPRPISQCDVRLNGAEPAAPWRSGLAAFRELVRDAQWQTAHVEFVLSSHFVRYAVIPGDPSAQSEEERSVLGAIIFRKTFGALSQDWHIALSDARKGLPTLGAAIPSDLIKDLRTSVGKHSGICSIRPDLTDAFNRIADDVKHGSAIFVLIDSGRVTIGRVADGGWTSVVSRPAPIDDALACARVLAEDMELCPFPENAAIWIRDLTGMSVFPAEMSGQVRTVPPPWPGHLAAALLP
ncbi:MAG: hypothetical protein ABIK82_03330 [Pseudomonadota bacterium]